MLNRFDENSVKLAANRWLPLSCRWNKVPDVPQRGSFFLSGKMLGQCRHVWQSRLEL
jgi:hypothetical protein